MAKHIRGWEDGKFNWWIVVCWGAILGLILHERSFSPVLGVCMVAAGFLLRHPLRGLDIGRMIWGYYGVSFSMIAFVWCGRTATLPGLFWLGIGCAALGYLLAAWERCRIAQWLTALLPLWATGAVFCATELADAQAMIAVAALMAIGTAILALWFPRAFLRAGLLLLSRTIYRIRVAREQEDDIPDRGAVVLVANHVSVFDLAFIFAVTPRPVRFMVDTAIYRKRRWLARWLRLLGFLEVPPGNHPKALAAFFDDLRARLRRGEAIAFFPEGGISGNGVTGRFHCGLERLVPDDVPVRVIPLRLGLYWGRLLAWANGRIHWIAPLRWPIPVTVTIGAPVSAKLGRYELWRHICEMGAEAEAERQYWERPVHIAFTEMVQHAPHTVCFGDYEGKALPNWEMLVRSLVLSRTIRRLELGDGDYVGVLLPGSTAAVTAILGVLFADRTPAMLNFTAGSEALAHACAQAKLKCVLTSKLFLAKLKLEPQPGWVMLEDLAKQIPKRDKLLATLACWTLPARLLGRVYAPKSRSDVERVGALLFTSGSSGKPKGVMLTHHNINSDVYSFWRVIAWRRDPQVLIGHMPLFHSYGLTVSFWFPALSGTRVWYMPNPLDAARVCRLIREKQVTLFVATPTFLQNYCRKAQPGDFDSLQVVITGAEKLRPGVVTQFEQLSHLTVTEGYGCTELSPIAAVNFAYSCFAMGKKVGKSGSIGQTLPGIAARVVGPESGEELGPNQVGLLEIKGPNVMAGYLDEPELTAKVIRDGWYSTGDLARIDEDGYIFLTGRQSRFSKIGGEMVPHELVESRLAELYPGDSRHFAVTGCRDAKRGERLLAFHNIDPAAIPPLIEQMRESGMPNLWIPKIDDFIRIDAMPVLASGKLDLQLLKRLAEEHAERTEA